MPREISYDSASHDLACHFLQHEQNQQGKELRVRRHQLAQVIQAAIEDWLEQNPEVAP